MKTLEPYIPMNEIRPDELLKLVNQVEPHRTFPVQKRKEIPGTLSLARGFSLTGVDGPAADDFRHFLRNCMLVRECAGGVPIDCRLRPELARPGRYENCRMEIRPARIRIEAENEAGLSRALLYLEDAMRRRNSPNLKFGVMRDWTCQRLRISRSPIASYRFGGGWELLRDTNFYPDEYLNRLRRARINTIWVAGLFREMIKSEVLPEITGNADEKALDNLRILTERAARYEIKVLFFCMEPRVLPPDHPVFTRHPELRGTVCGEGENSLAMLCTSQPLVLAYLEEAIRKLFTQVPLLGGMLQIFAGERATSCRSIDAYMGSGDRPCPRCGTMTQSEALAKLITFQFEAIRRTAPTADYLVWSYGIPVHDFKVKEEIYSAIPREVVWLENFEHGVVKEFFGKKVTNEEYSLSCTGPADSFRIMAQKQSPATPSVWPKFQFGNTYEMPLVPYIPVPSMAWRKQRIARQLKCSGALVSWIIGGGGDLMLHAFALAGSGKAMSEPRFLDALAATLYPPEAVAPAVKAWKIFDRAFQQYPCDKSIFYYGPIARSPGYKLYLTGDIPLIAPNYNWGIDPRRDIQEYATPTGKYWTGETLSPMEIAHLFRKIAGGFRRGEALLEHPALGQLRNVALAMTIILDSAANVYEFYELRNDPARRQRLTQLLQAEIVNASAMMPLLLRDPYIGFQSELLYYPVSVPILKDKIHHTRQMLKQLNRRTTK